MRKILYYLNKFDYSLPSPFDEGAEGFEVESSDGVRLNGTVLPGKGDLAFLVVHGLFAHHRAPGFSHIARSLTRHGPVFTFDLRGHGLSEGICTLGDREALDVGAVTVLARSLGRPIVLVGFSMGAAASVRSAALVEPADAVVAISGPARWDGPRRRSSKLLRAAWRAPLGTNAMKVVTGVRIARHWVRTETPAEVAHKIAPAPLIVVHGTDDDFFPPEEGEFLFRSAADPKDLWTIPGGGHAEALFFSPSRPPERERIDGFADEILRRLKAMWSQP